MLSFRRFLIFMLSAAFIAVGSLEAKLKKVPVNETTVIQPSSMKHKKVKTKKFKSKKARLKNKSSNVGKDDVIHMDDLTDKELAALISNSENVEVIVQDQRIVDTKRSNQGDAIQVEKRQANQQVAVETEASSQKVDSLSESSPNQVEVTKEKKKKKWQFWKRKKE